MFVIIVQKYLLDDNFFISKVQIKLYVVIVFFFIFVGLLIKVEDRQIIINTNF